MMLRFDPLQVFRSSNTPASLYARQYWLGESQTAQWKTDFSGAVTKLLREQCSEGSWNTSVIDTINHLFSLHLTLRESTTAVNAGLDWLLATTLNCPSKSIVHPEKRISIYDLRGLPFSPGHHETLILAATIFLATVFGRKEDKRVLAAYERLHTEGIRTNGRWTGRASLTNVLRALAVHPLYSESASVAMAINTLATTKNPKEKHTETFYKNFNMLAHLNLPQANYQFNHELERIYSTQSPQGNWGRAEPVWSTFLVVHALKRKGLL